VHTMRQLGALLCFLVLPSACGDTYTFPTLPSAPSTRISQGFMLSGFAYEHTADGLQPVGGLPLRVDGFRDRQTPETMEVVTDSAGRYEVAGLAGEFVLVGARAQDAYLSPCSVRVWQGDDKPKNVHIVPRTHLLAVGTPTSMPPFSRLEGYSIVDVVSGFVTERVPGGVRPVPEASVEHLYGDGQSGSPTGFTLTRADGSYVLCGYMDDFGQAVRVRKDGYRTGVQSIGPSWRRIDVELVRD
jgi:hypothetical protein